MNETSSHPDVERVLRARAREVGGAPVARALPQAGCRAVGPFVFLDHFGPREVAPGADTDVLPHPHIGLSTVTYLFEGEVVHRDSLGVVQTIAPGEINLMTAGAGIVHSERASPERRQRGGRTHGLQFWVALPAANEDDAPSFEHHGASALPTIPAGDRPGLHGRVLLGEAYGARSPATTPSRPVLVEVWLDAGAALEIPSAIEDAAIYVIAGALAIGDATYGARTLVVRRVGAALRARALEATHLVVLGGPRLDGSPSRSPRLIEWNFVATTRARIDAAKRRWRSRAFPTIPGDTDDRIPLPDEESPS